MKKTTSPSWMESPARVESAKQNQEGKTNQAKSRRQDKPSKSKAKVTSKKRESFVPSYLGLCCCFCFSGSLCFSGLVPLLFLKRNKKQNSRDTNKQSACYSAVQRSILPRPLLLSQPLPSPEPCYCNRAFTTTEPQPEIQTQCCCNSCNNNPTIIRPWLS